jgi:NAD(P)-dependent dehydrogenase (short-subunit alcohol dehydrogenase family)
MAVDFENRVALVTGAGNGLGRSYAHELARLGARVVVNDYGGSRDGLGGSASAAETVADEICANGGEAIADHGDVRDFGQCRAMVAAAVAKWGRLDILINSAGILRDSSFGKLTPDNWKAVVGVHLDGSAYCSLAAWDQMKSQGYGRILMTTSVSGLYGNFGQANYGAAKMGVVGLMNPLAIEGAKYDIRVNCISPTAATRMTEDILTPDMLDRLNVENVTPAALYLVSESCPNRLVMFAGAGYFSVLEIRESKGMYLREDQRSPDVIAEHFEEIADMAQASVYGQGSEHVAKILTASAARK